MLEDSELGSNMFDGFVGIVGWCSYGVEVVSMFIVEVEVFCEILCNDEFEILFNEIVNCGSIFGKVVRGEILVCIIEEGEVVFLVY